jgi:ElaB/YqjD/DUF883 family membrane-anchored ribosome-binding protein
MTEKGSFSEKAASAGDQARLSTAKGLDAAAEAVRDYEDTLPGGERVERFTRAAADGLESTASYLRRHDLSRMAGDLTTMVRENPLPSVVAAAAIGFIVGRVLTRD